MTRTGHVQLFLVGCLPGNITTGRYVVRSSAWLTGIIPLHSFFLSLFFFFFFPYFMCSLPVTPVTAETALGMDNDAT